MAEGKEKALMGKSPSKAQLNSIARAFEKAAEAGGRVSAQDMTRAMNMTRLRRISYAVFCLIKSQRKKSGGKVKKAQGMAKGGKMKSKGYAKGGKTMMKKSKGMARGGKTMMKKSKGMARGGKMMKKSKGMARGGKAKR